MIVYAEQDKWGTWTLLHYEQGEAGGCNHKAGPPNVRLGSPRKTFSTRLRSFNQFLARGRPRGRGRDNHRPLVPPAGPSGGAQ